MTALAFGADQPLGDVSEVPALEGFWRGDATAWLVQVASALQRWQAHPARTVVLLPHVRLLPVAKRMWLQLADAQAIWPRFETTSTWAQRLGGVVLGAMDFSHDRGADLLLAQSLLQRAGLGEQSSALAPHLVDCALQLAPLVSAVRPQLRAQWLHDRQLALSDTMDERLQRWELAVTSVALLWVTNTAWPTDILWQDRTRQEHDGLVLLQGYQDDALGEALALAWGERGLVIPWSDRVGSQAAVVQARDFEEEAQAVTACVLGHRAAGRVPVAVAAIDRMLVRRVRALLEPHGTQVRDDSGWKLSTTHVAAQLIAVLQAMAPDASADDVLDGLKPSGWRRDDMTSLEAALRRSGADRWRPWAQPRQDWPLVRDIEALRAPWGQRKSIGWWLSQTQALLQTTAQWTAWQADAAGQQMLEALHLTSPLVLAEADEPRWTLSEYVAWVRACLEGVSGLAGRGDQPAEVIILPLAQFLGQAFAAQVLCGCDQNHLPARPRASAWWTPHQRAALGLPDADALQRQAHRAWVWATAQQNTTVFWRCHDEHGESLGSAPALLQLLSNPATQTVEVRVASDGLHERSLLATPAAMPEPTAATLLPLHISASSYDDLRRCPYRFFALRMLGLQEVEDIDTVADKRDFGVWLHTVLRRFHEHDADGTDDAPRTDRATEQADRERLQRIADDTLAEACVVPEDFLPFEAGWPGLRDAYLFWWQQQKLAGVRVRHVERAVERPHPADARLLLKGQIDRIDSLPSDSTERAHPPVWRLIDYKTEDPRKTEARVKDPTEDTQLAFYAALVGQEQALEGAYLSLGLPKEQDKASPQSSVKLVPQLHLNEAREALLNGMQRDLQRLRQGHALPALGEGAACEHCAARGLCRRDFWAVGSAA